MIRWYRNYKQAVKIALEATERVKTLSNVYSSLVERYLQQAEELTRVRLELANRPPLPEIPFPSIDKRFVN